MQTEEPRTWAVFAVEFEVAHNTDMELVRGAALQNEKSPAGYHRVSSTVGRLVWYCLEK